MKRDLQTYPDEESMSRAAAKLVPIDGKGRIALAISGGSTPIPLFSLFAGAWRDRLPWDRIHIFWADERFVPVESSDSNFRLASEHFLDAVPIPLENVHRVPTDVEHPRLAAAEYDRNLRAFFGESGPTFDVAYLGLGVDGHTASLFPGQDVPSNRWAVSIIGPPSRPPLERITLTPQILNRSRVAAFLVGGRDKRGVLTRVLDGDPALPAAAIHGLERTVFLVDSEASSEPIEV